MFARKPRYSGRFGHAVESEMPQPAWLRNSSAMWTASVCTSCLKAFTSRTSLPYNQTGPKRISSISLPEPTKCRSCSGPQGAQESLGPDIAQVRDDKEKSACLQLTVQREQREHLVIFNTEGSRACCRPQTSYKMKCWQAARTATGTSAQ